jgi:hypothetical protein
MTIFVICRLHQSHIYNFKSLWKLWDNAALCLINQHIIKWHDTTKAYLHTLELELYRWRWVVSIGSSCCTPKSVPSTHPTGGWAGQKRKISCPCRDVNPILQFCAANHTTCGIPTLSHRCARAHLPPRYTFPPTIHCDRKFIKRQSVQHAIWHPHRNTWYGRRVHTRVRANMRAHITNMSHYGASVTDVGVPTGMHGLEAEVYCSDGVQNRSARAYTLYYVKLILNHYLVI